MLKFVFTFSQSSRWQVGDHSVDVDFVQNNLFAVFVEHLANRHVLGCCGRWLEVDVIRVGCLGACCRRGGHGVVCCEYLWVGFCFGSKRKTHLRHHKSK